MRSPTITGRTAEVAAEPFFPHAFASVGFPAGGESGVEHRVEIAVAHDH